MVGFFLNTRIDARTLKAASNSSTTVTLIQARLGIHGPGPTDDVCMADIMLL